MKRSELVEEAVVATAIQFSYQELIAIADLKTMIDHELKLVHAGKHASSMTEEILTKVSVFFSKIADETVSLHDAHNELFTPTTRDPKEL